jgi:hypothetical protein
MGSNLELQNSTSNATGNEVFQQLTAGLSQPYPWKMTLINDQVLNAASSAGGQVYVHGGMVDLLGNNKGLWAAVLSHETAHTALRHQVKTFLRQEYNQRMIQYYRARALAGDKSANWALIGFAASSRLALKKMERDQENDADQQGMLLMARAGYHPDYVFALHHRLLMDLGERSKLGTFFFSDHPRWETRDQRSDKVYVEALAEFNRDWPNASTSPGGKPPLVAFVGQPEAKEDKESQTADVSVPLYCRNADAPVDLALLFVRDNRPVKASDPQFADKEGNLVFRDKVDCLEKNEGSPIFVHVPASAVSEHDRSLKAFALIGSEGLPLAESRAFDVHFPKIKHK